MKTHLDSFPTPLPILGVLGQSPHYEIRLKGLGTKDVISEQGHFCQALKNHDVFKTYLSFCFSALASTASENLRKPIVNVEN